MKQHFTFHGQTTFIDKPKDTIIQGFQNTFINEDGTERDTVNKQLLQLVTLLLSSREIASETKEETLKAIHSLAEQVKEKKENKLTFKGTLAAISEVVSKAADIAGPSATIISGILKLMGIG
jgi:ERCC4-type nuclease